MGSAVATFTLVATFTFAATFTLVASFTMEGKWQADQLKLELTAEGEGVWHLSAHVANTMNCKVTKAGDSYSAGLVSSTRMLPPPDLQEREREVSSLLANLNSISVQGDGQLKIASDSSSLLLDRAQGYD